MKFSPAILFLILIFQSCQSDKAVLNSKVITSDIPLFWEVYDNLQSIADSAARVEYLQLNYIDKGSAGLDGIIRARNYTAEEFVNAINKYPKFWNSIRENTLQVDKYAASAEIGIEKLKSIYPELKPAKIFYSIGALRTPGTTIDSTVLMGAELCMGDQDVNTSEFTDRFSGLKDYFKNEPIKGLEFLNVHEYVHTQQNELVYNLLSIALYEGAAEFVAGKAVGEKDISPAIAFGKRNKAAVRAKFEEEMFNVHRSYNGGNWVWQDNENELKVRDLGYYIGYAICEIHYNQETDKKKAIKSIIELDYNNEDQVEHFVDKTQYFSEPLEKLFQNFENIRPEVVDVKIGDYKNGSKNIPTSSNTIALTFSEPMDKNYRNFDFGPLGESAITPFKSMIGFSEDGKTLRFKVNLKPKNHHQLLIGNGFRNVEGIPLKPFLIDFNTGE